MIKFFTYAVLVILGSLFVSMSDASAHGNHNNKIVKSNVEINQKTNSSEAVDIDQSSSENKDFHLSSGCPFSCCNATCASCCVTISNSAQATHAGIDAYIHTYMALLDVFTAIAINVDNPPPRS